MTAPVLAARDIDKSFGTVVALKKAGVTLRAGRVTAIVGENGAGKSTLAKILAGVLQPDRGEVVLDGKPVSFLRRADAINAGIGFVPQALSFISTLTLAENHLIGQSGIVADRAQAQRELAAACAELGVDLPCHVPLERLSLPERQLGEIASAVASGARVLLLDEPTSSLGPFEIERLIASVRRLAGAGTAIGLVTHRITEVLTGADFVAVLRAGIPVFKGSTEGLDADAIARLMVGVEIPAQIKLEPHTDLVRLSAEDVSVTVDGLRYLQNITFNVRAGEVVGFAGIASNSQTILAEAIIGLRKPNSGRILIDGIDVTGNARKARGCGVAHIPDDRKTGIVPHLTVAENASVFCLRDGGFAWFGIRSRRAEYEHAAKVAERTDVRPRDPALPAMALSGGNQQKLLVGRELDGKAAAVVAHGPTQGLDLSASADIRRRLTEVAAAGAAVLVISADLDEILSMCHRVFVLSLGRITDSFDLTSGPPDMVRFGRAIGGTRSQAA
jgi:general nucleoside transport system ATP-binding protein